MKTELNQLTVILKVSERCNINCTYCYFFNSNDKTYKNHAAFILLETVNLVANFLSKSIVEHNIKFLRIDFHGGEPLLLKPDYFSQICEIFTSSLGNLVNLQFVIQTNAILLNDNWLSILDNYKVNIGISIDGPAAIHDKYRVDHFNNGTYSRVRKGIDLIKKKIIKKEIKIGVGALAVINPEYSGKDIYRHFVDDIGFNSMDFLLPDITHDQAKKMPNFSAESYGKYLVEVFDEWINDDNPEITIRAFTTILNRLLKKQTYYHDFGGWYKDFLLLTISSDGDISPDDTIRSIDLKFMNLGLNVSHSKLQHLFDNSFFQTLQEAGSNIPTNCLKCQWQNNCRGGGLVQRYSQDNMFDNSSVFCSGLKLIFARIQDELEKNSILQKYPNGILINNKDLSYF